MSKTLPIGFWIRQADNLLTEGINNIQLSFGLTRTEWQVLNIIYEKGAASIDEAAQLLSPFAVYNDIQGVFKKLDAEGLLTEEGGPVLTPKGNTVYHDCLEKQNAFRQKVMTGISEQQYEQVIATLQAMIENMKKT
jgi:DNA-binding MarR family transcriptional regulator